MKTLVQVRENQAAKDSSWLTGRRLSLAHRRSGLGPDRNTEDRSLLNGGPRGFGFNRISILPPGLQAKLTVGEPGDSYEQEADQVAERVMRMPALPIAPAGPEQRGASGAGAVVDDGLASQSHSLRAGGEPLPAHARNFFEPRFGVDFSKVRVHADQAAAEAARSLRARAFTLRSDIVFGAGQYAPSTPNGRRLLAHELTHVVQQGQAEPAPARRPLSADGSISRAVNPVAGRAQLMIQKADGDKANTAFGEFKAVKYHPLTTSSGGKTVEVGVDMFLQFNPGAAVDAKQIALTQAATGKLGGTAATAADRNFGRRSATSGAGQGQFIDVLEGFPSPLYASANKPTAGADATKLTSYPTVPSKALTAAEVTARETATGIKGETRTGFGKHGFRFKDGGTLKGPEAAELYDSPHLGTANDSEQIFESTALAIEGTQKDTYYGSVNWGWRRDTAGKFTILPFKAISQGTPSVNFLTAASIFNTATEDFNWGVSVATADILDTTNMSNKKASVTRGTALTWGGAHGPFGGVDYNVVVVKDGASKGKTGAIKSAEMSMMDVGRANVALPVTKVHTINATASMVGDPAKAAATKIESLSKGTRVTVIDATTNADWSKIRIVDGALTNKEGWVKKSLLTQEALGTH